MPEAINKKELTKEYLLDKVEEVIDQAKKYDLFEHVFALLKSEPFFAALSRHIHKTARWDVPTAAVWINPHTAHYEMIYNPVFMCQLNSEETLAVLKHEFYHIVYKHLTSRLPSRDWKDNKIWNFATDLAINSHLEGELPDFCLMPEKGEFKAFKKGMHSEYYYAALKANMPPELQKYLQKLERERQEAMQEGPQPPPGFGNGKNVPGNNGDPEGKAAGGDLGQFDDHDYWQKSASQANHEEQEAIDKIAEERLRQIMKKAAYEASRKGNWGSISASCREYIKSLIAPKLDWKKITRSFVKASQRSHKSSSIKRINKRFPYMHPGVRINRVANIGVYIDQSGSVGNDMLAIFFAELNALSKLATFTVIPFDHGLANEHIFTWKRGQTYNPVRVRSGGTDFNEPTKHCNESNFDGMIVLTDMQAPKPIPCKVRRLWITTPDCAEQPYFKPDAKDRIVAIKKT